MYQNVAEEKFNNLVKNYKTQDITVLAIESSCDETSVAIVRNGREVLSNIVSTQIDIHRRFGGVVPEVASRNHLLAVNNVTREALDKAGLEFKDIDAIAVTYGAGLVGALMVGVNYAKALAYSLKLPLIAVNHIKGHISANYITFKDLKPPFVSLIVSGGHSALVKVNNYTDNTLLGSTIDDAVGECYDKVAKVLGLEYPGGPNIDKLSKLGNANIQFIKHGIMGGTHDFSFSGLKTAVINYVHKITQNGENLNVNDICASFQRAVLDELVPKSISACKKYRSKKLVVAGGVSANSALREELLAAGKKEGVEVLFPELCYCGDNAAMIGAEAYFNIISGVGLADMSLTATPNLNLKFTARALKSK